MAITCVTSPALQGCVHYLFEQQVARTPDAVAVEVEGATLTYSELNRRANQLAHHLLGRGVQANTLVAICLQRSLEMMVGIFGILKAGGAYVPLDPAYPRERLAFMIEASNARVVVTQDSLVTRLEVPTGTEVVRLDGDAAVIASHSDQNPRASARPDDLIYVIFTSGSTGRPKGAAVYHRGFTNLLDWFVTEWDIGPHDRTLLVSSLSFDLTQKNLFAVLLRGGSLHLYPPVAYDIQRLAHSIARHGITLVNCTPSAFYPLIEPAEDACFTELASLRLVVLGGEPISVARTRPWLTHPTCRAEIANTYGPTECTDICGFYRLNRDNIDRFPFVPLGGPIHNVQLVVVDEHLQPCPPGTAGELCVGGAGVGAGYINDPELTAARFLANPFPEIQGPRIYRTGDQVRELSDGVLEFLGRLDHQVKVRGFRIELHEIEGALEAHPNVREAVVVVQESPAGGGDPRLVSFWTTHASPPPDASALKQYLHGRLPDYMIPSVFVRLEQFPLSPNGKVDRQALKNRPVIEAPAVPATIPPMDDLQARILRIWLEVLGRPSAGLDENFFDLGGDSIKLAQVHARLIRLTGSQFPITDLFAHTTVRALTAHFTPGGPARDQRSAIADRARRQREMFQQRRPLRS